MKLKTHQQRSQAALRLPKEKSLLEKIGQKAVQVPKWCLKQGYNALFGSVVVSVVQGALISSKNFRIINSFLFNHDQFRRNPMELKKFIDSEVSLFKLNGWRIPRSIDSNKILTSKCPHQEYLKQMNLINKADFSFKEKQLFEIFVSSVAPSVIEELAFRWLLQDVLLKKLVGKFIRYVSPSHASIVDNKIYSAIRIFLTSLAFSTGHNTQRQRETFGDKYIDLQVFTALILGVALGILKETHGLAACIGAHAFQNFVSHIPDTFAKC